MNKTIASSTQPPTQEYVRELEEAFRYCDINKDGRLQYLEFVDLLDNLDAGMSAQDCRIGFYEIDANHDNLIDFPEFMAWWIE